MEKNFIQSIKKLPKNENGANEMTKNEAEDESVILLDKSLETTLIKKFDRVPDTDEINMPLAISDFFHIKKNAPKETAERNARLLDMPIAATQILFTAIALVKNSQFNLKKYPKQLALFEEEFMTKQNAVVALVMDIKELYSTKREDGTIRGRADKVKQAVDLLQDNFTEWVVGKNERGERVEEKLSFIERPKFTRGKLYFETSVYWVDKMINMKGYNPVLYKLPKLLSNTKAVFFSVFLERFEVDTWFNYHYETINTLFALEYKSAKDLGKSFLYDMREKLNKHSLKSFIYKIDGDYIKFQVISLKELADSEVALKKETSRKKENLQFANYLKRRHQLSENKRKNIEIIANQSITDKRLIFDAYQDFIRDCRAKKVKVTDYIKEDFTNIWNQYIFERYKLTERYHKFAGGAPAI